MNRRVIDTNVMYFLNTGEFYKEHKLLRDALDMFGERTTKEELQNYRLDLSISIGNWVRKPEYKRVMDGSLIPTLEERKAIALEIIDYWSNGLLSEEILAL